MKEVERGKMSLVERLQGLAKERGTTFKQLERDAGLGNGVIRRWDKQSPRLDILVKVADCLQASLDYLVYGSDETAPPSWEGTEVRSDENTFLASAEPGRFPQILKTLRKARGLTQRELAEELGIGYGTVIGYENQKREPNARAIVALEQYFGVTAAALLGLEDTAPAASCCDAPDKPLPLNDAETRLLEDFRCLSPENQATLRQLAAKFAAIDKALNAWLDADDLC